MHADNVKAPLELHDSKKE